MPIYQMFDIIAQSAVGRLGNVGLIYIQIFLSLFLEIKFLFSAMKSKPILARFSIAMIPMVLIATYSIGCGIIFSAFLGEGPQVKEMLALLDITLSERCIYEILLAVTVFFVLMLIYSRVYHLKPLEWLMTFGVETLAALSLLTLYGGLLVEGFPYTVVDLSHTDLFLARWPIYGYFTVLFKCFVLVISLFLGLVLRERNEKAVDEEEKYTDRRGYYEKRALKYLTKNDALIGVGFLIFGAAAQAFFLWNIFLEDADEWNPGSVFSVLLILALFSFLEVLGGFCIHRALRPRTSKAYRQLLAMGDKDMVLQLFCEEIVDKKLPEADLWTGKAQIRTEHFLLRRQGIKTQVEWRGIALPYG